MNYYELGKYAGHRNIPLHTLINFDKNINNLNNYFNGYIHGRDILNNELRLSIDELRYFLTNGENT